MLKIRNTLRSLAISLMATGCVNGPQPGRPPSTPYQGDAIWNISLATHVPSVESPHAPPPSSR